MNLKQWQCKNKHTLGMIQINGDGVPQLMLYRHAVDMNAEKPAEVELMIGPLIGRMPVLCDAPDCGTVTLWDMSDRALAEMIVSLDEGRLEKVRAYVTRRRALKAEKKFRKARASTAGVPSATLKGTSQHGNKDE